MAEKEVHDGLNSGDGRKAAARRGFIREQLIVKPGTSARLTERDPAWDGGPEYVTLSKMELKRAAKAFLSQEVEELAGAQELLWASGTYALLAVFQGMDASGKDSTIKHVMSGVNPQGVRVVSFKQPSVEELDHDFLWRVSKALPAKGQIGVFNRSHYEEVAAVRVHPEWLDKQRLPPGPRGKSFWTRRFEDINSFEQHMDRNGTKIVKFFLHVSKEEQKRRLLARLDEPEKNWKFKAADVDERELWDAYMQAYEEAITATSTEWAPWYVIPADRKPLMRAIVAGILLDTIRTLDLKWPTVSDEERAANEESRLKLEAESSQA